MRNRAIACRKWEKATVLLWTAVLILRVYPTGGDMGLGDRDGPAIVQIYEQWTGVPVVPRESA